MSSLQPQEIEEQKREFNEKTEEELEEKPKQYDSVYRVMFEGSSEEEVWITADARSQNAQLKNIVHFANRIFLVCESGKMVNVDKVLYIEKTGEKEVV